MNDLVMVQRLLLVAALAGVIGFERERHGRAAGFRTHILVGVGSCLVMLTGLHLVDTMAQRVQLDPTRMTAQVVSGIGFLGAGTILRSRASVRGLTTAASLWAVGGIGLAAGAGFTWGAVAGTLVILIALFGFSRLERAMRKTWFRTLVVESSASGQSLAEIRQILAEYEVEIRDFDIVPIGQPDRSRIKLHVKLLDRHHEEEILGNLLRVKGTSRAHWT